MGKILISAGAVLSFGSIWFMILSKLHGKADIVGGPKKHWINRIGWICLIMGVIAQIIGIWFAELFQGVSSSFASTPAVNSLTESGKSILDWLKQIEPILYAVIVICTGFAAVAAWLSARASKKATKAQLYIRLMEEYGSKEMTDALHGLKTFSGWEGIAEALEGLRQILPKAQRFKKDKGLQSLYASHSETVKSNLEENFDSNRRVIKYYFLKLLRLHENKFLPKNLMKALGKVSGVDLFYDVIKPIEFALDKNFKVSNFVKIEQICGRYDEGGN